MFFKVKPYFLSTIHIIFNLVKLTKSHINTFYVILFETQVKKSDPLY